MHRASGGRCGDHRGCDCPHRCFGSQHRIGSPHGADRCSWSASSKCSARSAGSGSSGSRRRRPVGNRFSRDPRHLLVASLNSLLRTNGSTRRCSAFLHERWSMHADGPQLPPVRFLASDLSPPFAQLAVGRLDQASSKDGFLRPAFRRLREHLALDGARRGPLGRPARRPPRRSRVGSGTPRMKIPFVPTLRRS